MSEAPAQPQTPDDGGPAFPMPSGDEPRVNTTTHYNEGMSLRDWFAGQALVALIRIGAENVKSNTPPGGTLVEEPTEAWYFGTTPWESRIGEDAYGIADAMLAARKEARP